MDLAGIRRKAQDCAGQKTVNKSGTYGIIRKVAERGKNLTPSAILPSEHALPLASAEPGLPARPGAQNVTSPTKPGMKFLLDANLIRFSWCYWKNYPSYENQFQPIRFSRYNDGSPRLSGRNVPDRAIHDGSNFEWLDYRRGPSFVSKSTEK
jgi:hypothetical protein